MATQLQTLRSIPLTGYSISTDSTTDFNNYIAGILSDNVTDFNRTISANAFVSRNGLSVHSDAKLSSIEFSNGYSIRRTEDNGALQITGGKTFNTTDANGRLILYGKNNSLSGYAILKAQGENSSAEVLSDKRIILSAGENNSVAIVGGSNSSLTYTGSSVLGNGFACAGLPTNKRYQDNFFRDLSSQQAIIADYLQLAGDTGWVTLKITCPANMWIEIRTTTTSTDDGITLLDEVRRTYNDNEVIALSVPVAKGQWVRLHCSNKPTRVSLNRFLHAISYLEPTSTRDTKGGKSYDSILGDVITNSGLDGISENIYYIDENATEDPNVAQPDKETNNTPNER